MFFFFKNKQLYDFEGTHTGKDVAKYIIHKCTSENRPISSLQLQKILYYVQAASLKEHSRALFTDEIEAWPFGPVVSSVYRAYCGYGAAAIYERKEPEKPFSEEEKELIDRVVREKMAKQSWNLVNETHAPGKPWALVYREGLGKMQVIPKDVIIEYEHTG